ncbi:MAG: ABC transporter ATP-binding protein [Thermoanaerobaculia bacterium]
MKRAVKGREVRAAAAAPKQPAVSVENISKHYRRWGKSRAFGTLKSAFLGRGLASSLTPSEVVAALSNVSFRVERGETFGVIGANGCGKSTLLKLVAGILKPTSGSLHVNGKVSALIELGAGFHPEISGRENVVINGVMLGLTRRQIEEKLPQIIAFSGLADFIDQPVKTYSSGMYVRLGFAVAVHLDPDILVIDEVLAVGDEAFSHRCLDTIREFAARGKTIFFVTHSLALVEELCDRVLYLEEGKVKGLGDPREMLAAYRLDVSGKEGARLAAEHTLDQDRLRSEPVEALPAIETAVASRVPEVSSDAGSESAGEHAPASSQPPSEESSAEVPPPVEVPRARRWGDRSAVITACRLLDASNAERYAFRSGDEIVVEIKATPNRPLEDVVVGIGLFTIEDVCVHGTNSDLDGFSEGVFDAPATIRITMPRCDLAAGTYLLDVAVHAKRGTPYDYWRGACRFRIDSPTQDVGLYRPERRWQVEGGLTWKPS